MDGSEPIVDLAFPMTPGRVPVDHGYALYAGLVAAVPELHEAAWLAIHPLSGRKVGDSTLVLTGGSHVTLRVPLQQIPTAISLVNKTLRVGDQVFELGQPVLRALAPSPSLFAWQVAIRLTEPPRLENGALDMEAFRRAAEAEAKRQLQALGIQGELKTLAKRTLSVKDQRLIAFSVEVNGLSDPDSITLQAKGLGGKRRMGCGVFRPSHQAEPNE